MLAVLIEAVGDKQPNTQLVDCETCMESGCRDAWHLRFPRIEQASGTFLDFAKRFVGKPSRQRDALGESYVLAMIVWIARRLWRSCVHDDLLDARLPHLLILRSASEVPEVLSCFKKGGADLIVRTYI